MIILTTILLFSMLTMFLFKYMTNTMTSIIILEMMSFLTLMQLAMSIPTSLNSLLLLMIFSLFILESVLGLVFLINMVSFSSASYSSIKITT